MEAAHSLGTKENLSMTARGWKNENDCVNVGRGGRDRRRKEWQDGEDVEQVSSSNM